MTEPAEHIVQPAARTPLEQLRQYVEAAIQNAERDITVNSQFRGGLEPIIGILRAALAAVPPAEPAPKDIFIRRCADGEYSGGDPLNIKYDARELLGENPPCNHHWIPIWERHEQIGRQCWRCGQRVLNTPQ